MPRTATPRAWLCRPGRSSERDRAQPSRICAGIAATWTSIPDRSVLVGTDEGLHTLDSAPLEEDGSRWNITGAEGLEGRVDALATVRCDVLGPLPAVPPSGLVTAERIRIPARSVLLARPCGARRLLI